MAGWGSAEPVIYRSREITSGHGPGPPAVRRGPPGPQEGTGGGPPCRGRRAVRRLRRCGHLRRPVGRGLGGRKVRFEHSRRTPKREGLARPRGPRLHGGPVDGRHRTPAPPRRPARLGDQHLETALSRAASRATEAPEPREHSPASGELAVERTDRGRCLVGAGGHHRRPRVDPWRRCGDGPRWARAARVRGRHACAVRGRRPTAHGSFAPGHVNQGPQRRSQGSRRAQEGSSRQDGPSRTLSGAPARCRQSRT
jgi:hypothetical protein